jgi:hypothetical protein
MSASKPRGRRPSGPPGAARPGRASPPPTGSALDPPGAGGSRRLLERVSARPLLYLRQLPAWFPAAIMAVLLLAGLALPGWTGAAALVPLALFLGWLAALSWPALPPQGRLLRAAAVAGVLVIAAIQASR